MNPKQCHRNVLHGLYTASECPLCYRPKGATGNVGPDDSGLVFALGVPAGFPVPPDAQKRVSGVRQRKAANKTEASFGARLKTLFPDMRIEREGITLRWLDGMTYTPDWVIWPRTEGKVWLFETKGPFIRRTGLEKFRAARAHWPMFEFELWQRDSGYNWTKLL